MRRIGTAMVLVAAVLLSGGLAHAEGWTEVKADQVKKMMDAGDVLVINPLSNIEFNALHIKGSVNIPMHRIKTDLPADKNKKLVFYCLGVRCVAAPDAGKLAVELGYKNVYVFKEGLPGWVQAGYPTVTIEPLPDVEVPSIATTELKQMLDANAPFVLVDIRFTKLAREYWIDSSKRINVPLDELAERYKEIPNGKKIVIIDEIGKRATVAGRYLKAKGYGDVAFVDGGMQKWAKDGLPVKQ